MDNAALFDELLAKTIVPKERADPDCLIWNGTYRPNRKYPALPIISQYDQRSVRRIMWEIWNDAELEPGARVQMCCTTVGCVAPTHITCERVPEQVSVPSESIIAALLEKQTGEPPPDPLPVPKQRTVPIRRAKRTPPEKCVNDHPYVPGSYTVDGKGVRHCRICRRATRERSLQKKGATTPPNPNLWRQRALEYAERLDL